MTHTKHFRPWAALALGLFLAACSDDAPVHPPDDAAVDAAPVDTPDIDTPPPPPPPPSRVDLTAGGHLTGGTLVVDIQLGHALAPHPASGGALTATPAAPVVP